MSGSRRALVLLLLLGACARPGPQVADPRFVAAIDAPVFRGEGPRVCLDEGHDNFHTSTGRYAPFVAVLRADGYRVDAARGPFSGDALARCDVLVVANALHPRNREDWSLPTPSAFAPEEVAALRAWVEAGGGLWLIADHMPFAGAAAELGAAFGFELANGFALRSGHQGPDLFTRAEGIAADPLTDGDRPGLRVDQIATFTGSAFRPPPDARVLLTLGPGFVSLEPQRAWQFDEATPRRDVAGWAQGAAVQRGAGRVVVFGEAAMFTSQVTGDRPAVGLTHPDARDNTRLLRNLALWLATPSPTAGPAPATSIADLP